VGNREARGAWVWIGLTPLGWIVGLIPGFGIGLIESYGQEGEHAGPLLWLIFEMLWLAAPTVAVSLAIRAARAGSRSGKIALGVAGVLLLATMAFFVMAAVNGFPGTWITVLTAGVAVAGAVGLTWRTGRTPVPLAAEHGLASPSTYWADLTTGHGDFPAVTTGTTTTSYQPDGFHLRSAQADGFRPVTVSTPASCTAATVTATVTEVSSPAGAGFGPWCFHDPDNGYGMALARDGQVTITHLENGNPTAIGGGHAAAWLRGQTRELAIVCQLGGTSDRVSAFVDGAKVADMTPPTCITEINATGFAATAPKRTSGPGEWAVTGFLQW
jgi:hypothetical protein